MSQVTGHGDVYVHKQGTDFFTGTYNVNSEGTLEYDDNHDGTIDKTFSYYDDGSPIGWYFRPPGSDESNAIARVEFFCLLSNIDGCFKWLWRESDRGNTNNGWESATVTWGHVIKT